MKIGEGQVAVITGAGSGIGRALALLRGQYGMRIIAADIEAQSANETVSEIFKNGGKAFATRVDVSNPESVERLAETVWQQFGGCQLLCNNAGVAIEKPVDECTYDDWQWVIGVNLMGIANAIASFLPRLRKQAGPAHILNTSSMAGLVPLAMTAPYVASKYAVVGLSEALQIELSCTAIGVSVLCPGAAQTRIFESERNRPAYDKPPLKTDICLDEMGLSLDKPYRRVLEPEQVAEIALESITQDRFYITTHPEWLPLFEQRANAITRAFYH